MTDQAREAFEMPSWLPLAKRLSAQLKAAGADVHPSKLEIWLEYELDPIFRVAWEAGKAKGYDLGLSAGREQDSEYPISDASKSGLTKGLSSECDPKQTVSATPWARFGSSYLRYLMKHGLVMMEMAQPVKLHGLDPPHDCSCHPPGQFGTCGRNNEGHRGDVPHEKRPECFGWAASPPVAGEGATQPEVK